MLRKLGEASKAAKIEFTVKPETIAANIVKSSKKVKGDKTKSRKIQNKLRRVKSLLPKHTPLDDPFTIEELQQAINGVKIGKAAGMDGMYPEFIKKLGKRALRWLLKLFNKIFQTSNLPSLLKKINNMAGETYWTENKRFDRCRFVK